MEKEYDIICFGVIVADILAPGVTESVFEKDMTRVSQVKIAPGGDAFNQALNLSALGYKVALIGRKGNDSTGDFLSSYAEKHNIDISHFVLDQQFPTSTTIVLILPNGERHFIGTLKGTNNNLQISDFLIIPSLKAKVVSLGSLYGSLTLLGKSLEPIFDALKKKNVILVADMMHPERGSFDDAIHVLKYLDYFFPNENEARSLTKKETIEECAEKGNGPSEKIFWSILNLKKGPLYCNQ